MDVYNTKNSLKPAGFKDWLKNCLSYDKTIFL